MNHTQRRIRGLFYFLIAGILMFLVSAFFTAPIMTPPMEKTIPQNAEEVRIQSGEELGDALARFIFIFMGFLLAPVSYSFYRKGRRYFKVPKEISFENSTDHVLYLRCFNDDSITEKSPERFSNKTEEEVLMENLKRISPPVAIGCPSEPTSPLGAYRVYVSDEEWKNKVAELCKNAQLVVLRVGTTEGLSWEVLHCLQGITDLKRLVFVLPYMKKMDLLSLGNLISHINSSRADIDRSEVNFNKPCKGSISSLLYFVKTSDGKYQMKQSSVTSRKLWNRFVPYSMILEKAWRPILQEFGKFNAFKYYYRRVAVFALIIAFCSFLAAIPTIQKMQEKNYADAIAAGSMNVGWFVDRMIHQVEENPFFAANTQELNVRGKISFLNQMSQVGMLRLPDEDLVKFYDITLAVSGFLSPEELSQSASDGSIVMNVLLQKFPKEDVDSFIDLQAKAALLEMEYYETYGVEQEEQLPLDSPEDVAAAKKAFQETLTPEQKMHIEVIQALVQEVEETPTEEQLLKIYSEIQSLNPCLKQVQNTHFRAILIRQSLMGEPFYFD